MTHVTMCSPIYRNFTIRQLVVMVNLQLLVNTEREPLLAAEPGVVAWSMLNLFS